MADISQLVISVDSKNVVTATGNLELLNKVGAKSEKTTETLDQSVKKLTKQFERQARNAGKSANEIKILDLKAKGATTAQLKAAQAAMKNAEAMKKQADAARFAAQSAGQTGGAFRAMRGSTQQLSWQLQDVAVQAQMGTSAFMIMGQQGPQIASIFGSGGAVFGAVIAFGSILAGSLYHALTGTSEALGDLEDDVSDLIDEFDDLTGAMRELALLQAAKEQDELAKAIKNGHDEIKRLGEVYEAQGQQIQHTEQSTKNYSDAVLKQNAIIQKAGIRHREITRAVDGVTSSYEDLVQKLIDERKEIGANSVVLAYQEAVRAGANDEQLRGIVLLAAQNLAAKEAIEKTEEAIAADKKATKEKALFIANLDKQHNLMKLTGEDLYIYQANQAGATDTDRDAIVAKIRLNAETKEEIRLAADAAKAKIKADADAAKAKAKAEADALKRGDDASLLLEKIALENMSELEQLEAHLIKKGGLLFQYLQEGHITLDQYLAMDAELQATYRTAEELAIEESNKKKLESAKAYADAKASLDNQVLASAYGLAGDLANAAEEGSNAQKALFAIQKAIAIATTIVNTEMAAIAAVAPPPIGLGPVAGAPYSFAIRAMGYASAGIIAGTAIAGGRALGGQVRGGESYLVGERGPELLTMGTSGRIATNENLKNAVGGNSGSAVTVNQTINVTTGIQSTVRAEIVTLMPQIAQAAKGAVADARLRGGNFSKAMSGA